MAAENKKAENEQPASQPKEPQPEKLHGTLGMLPHYYIPLSGIMRPSAEDEPDKDERPSLKHLYNHPKASQQGNTFYISDDPEVPYQVDSTFPVSILKSINSGGQIPSSKDEPDKDEEP